MVELATQHMDRRVTDVTKRLALSARLLIVAVAFLLSVAPGVANDWADQARTCGVGNVHDERRFSVSLGFAKAASAGPAAIASSAPLSSPPDGDRSGHDIAPGPHLDSVEIEKPHTGYLLLHGQRVVTAFAPRGPPRA